MHFSNHLIAVEEKVKETIDFKFTKNQINDRNSIRKLFEKKLKEYSNKSFSETVKSDLGKILDSYLKIYENSLSSTDSIKKPIYKFILKLFDDNVAETSLRLGIPIRSEVDDIDIPGVFTSDRATMVELIKGIVKEEKEFPIFKTLPNLRYYVMNQDDWDF